jgi:hypothetical protein
MKIQNIIKVFVKNQFWEERSLKNCKTPTARSHLAIGSNRPKGPQPLGATRQRGDWVGPPLLWPHHLTDATSAAASPTARSRCSLPLSASALLYKYQELGCKPSLTLHSRFFTPSHSLCSITCKNIFPQSLTAWKLCRKFLSSRPPSQAHGLFNLISLT